jgi:DNA-binding beta-propeller fold protein YncE
VSILAATGAALGSIGVGARPHGLVVDSAAGRAFVVNTGDDTLSVVDTQRQTTLRTMPLNEPLTPEDMSVDARHGRVFVAEAGHVLVLDARTGRVRARLSVDGPVNGLAVDSQSGHLYVTVGQALDELDPQTGQRLRAIAVGVNPGAVAVDAQRGRVFVANTGDVDDTGSPLGPGSVSVVDARRGTVVQTVAVGVDPQAMAVDERSGRVIVVNTGGVVPRADPWARIPGWLRRWLPFVPPAGSATRSEAGSVSILDRNP